MTQIKLRRRDGDERKKGGDVSQRWDDGEVGGTM